MQFQQRLVGLQEHMMSFAIKLTANRDDALDLLQDTTLKVLDNQEKFVDNFFLQNTAAAHTSAANVSILVSMSPILTVILAQLFSRKGEKLGKLVYIGALVAIVGVVLVVLNGTLSFHLSPLGDLLALAAALMWAVYSILVKKYTERYDNFLVTRRVFLWAFLTSLPLVLLTDGMPSLSPLFSQPKILISWLLDSGRYGLH